MNKTFITTVSGVTLPGLIKSLAEITRLHGGEWASSKVIKLGGHFTALLKVTIKADAQVALEAEFSSRFPALQFLYADIISDTVSSKRMIKLMVDCNDRPGLTREIDGILSELDVELESIESHRYQVLGLGETVFSSTITLTIPEQVSTESVIASLENLSDDVRVSKLFD